MGVGELLSWGWLFRWVSVARGVYGSGKRTFGVILVMKTSVPVEMSALVFVAVHFRDGSSVILC